MDDLEPTPGFADEIQRVLDSIPTPQPAQPTDEKEAARQRWLEPAQPSQPNPAPPVGTSPLARQLEEEGWFARREAENAAEAEQARQRAIEESQGWSAGRLAAGVRDFFQRNAVDYTRPGPDVTGDLIYPPTPRLTPQEAQEAARQELETRQWVAPLARGIADRASGLTESQRATDEAVRSLWNSDSRAAQATAALARPITMSARAIGSVAEGLIGSVANKQEQALARAQRMVRGEETLPTLGYWQAAVLTGQRSIAEMFTSMPLEAAGIIAGYGTGTASALMTGEPFQWEDNKLYRFGQRVEAGLKLAFPNDPARQFELGQTLAQGLGSTMAFGGQGAVASLLGAGTKGALALIALSGAAAQTPDEFARVTEAMSRGNATETDRALVTLANLALGATEALPFAPTLGAAARGWRARVGHGLGQLIEETPQETGQNLGQNVTRMLTYDPNQDPYEGVLEAAFVAALSGGGAGMMFSGGGHGAPAAAPPGQQGPGAARRLAARAMDTFLDPLARAENERHNAAIAAEEARRNPERDWAQAQREARTRSGGVRTDVEPVPVPAQPETAEQRDARLRDAGALGFVLAIGGGEQ